VEPSGFGVDDEGVGHPQLVHESAVQAQRLVGVIVGQAVVAPALAQEHGHGVVLPRTARKHTHRRLSHGDTKLYRKKHL